MPEKKDTFQHKRLPYNFNQLRVRYEEYEYNEDSTYIPTHSHEFYEIELLMTPGTATMNNSPYDFSYGVISLCTPSDFHSFTVRTHLLKKYNISFDDTFVDCPYVLSILTQLNGKVIPLNENEITFYSEVFNKFQKTSEKKGDIYIIQSKKILNFLLMELINSSNNQESFKINTSTSIFTAISYIQKNFTKTITLEDVAEKTFLSKCHFSNLFHKEVGVTFSQYLIDIRLKHVCFLLSNKSDPIADIAQASGFNSEKHFYRLFRKKYGITPTKYRKLHQKKEG